MMGRSRGQKVGPLLGCTSKEKGAGGWLYSARVAAGLTILDLAARSRVSVRTIKRIEAGERGAGWRVIGRLRSFLGVKS